ncbi:MAG TPA: hypothetical protein ENK06_12705, partial [Gammaproteobacteria bacterium]|nr:hypothetical protein [Gammaproteobacteria bacterium]
MESLKHKFTNTFARLPGEFFRQTRPTPLDNCHLVNVNEKMASKLGITPHIYQSRLFIDVFNGVQTYAGFTPIATVYAGHQFGTYVPQLGDGRAILLGEMATGTGEPHELQAKGAGLTHYSRSGDGRAVLRSTIREYLCSSAMYGLGIPTTQALCLMASTTEVYRETIEKAALLIRVAPSFIRFGSFEYFHYQSRPDLVKKLADYTIQKYFPQAIEQANPYGFFFQAVVTRTA